MEPSRRDGLREGRVGEREESKLEREGRILDCEEVGEGVGAGRCGWPFAIMMANHQVTLKDAQLLSAGDSRA